MKTNKRTLGGAYERMALALAVQEGAEPVETNYRTAQGEIDLIFKDGRYLVFAEVKYRAGSRFGSAEAAVDHRKQRTICRLARAYLYRKRLGEDVPVRFDVFAISPDADGTDKVRWIRNAFQYHL